MKRKHHSRPRRDGETVAERSCTSKIKYPTEMLAVMGAKRHLYRSREKAKSLWTYPCMFCSGWHLSSRLTDHTRVEA